MKFADLVADLELRTVVGSAPETVTGVSRDSRTVCAGNMYVAMGPVEEQAVHILEACARGASVIVTEHNVSAQTRTVPWFTVANSRAAFSRTSAVAHGLKHRCPKLFAAVGTAGKSTTVHCGWWSLGSGAARVGTIGWNDGITERPNPQTTPPPEQLHAFLAGLPVTCPGVMMEVSSHACDQRRCEGLRFTAIAFTGIGHDHLDYHGSHEAYVAAKLSVFRWLIPGGMVVINAEDPRYDVISAAARAAGGKVLGLGVCSGDALISPRDQGWELSINGTSYPLPMLLPGAFNAWNAAAGALLAHAAGVPLTTALERLSSMPPVPGRLELLATQPDTYVDYAHTPDELEVMLTALRRHYPGRRIVCVFGCGGDRDVSKRGPMGRAALIADVVIVTTDNSRSEDPHAIARDIIAGLPTSVVVHWDAQTLPLDSVGRQVVVEHDRATAIGLARTLAGIDGIAVIAGKGHETEQIMQGRTISWDDRAFVRSLEKKSVVMGSEAMQ